jgi:glycosyltransferase involved in cell wall biosynthesis
MISTALIIERTFTALGGAERSITELADELANQGIGVRILAAAGQHAQNCTVLCTDNPHRRTSFHTFAKTLRTHLSKNHYDIVHSTLPFDFADIYQPRGGSCKEAMLQNAASFPNPVIRCWKRCTHFMNFRRTALLRAEKKLCSGNNKIIIAALSDYVGRQFIRRYHLPPERIAVIPNGVDVRRLAEPADAAAFRKNILEKMPAHCRENAVLFLFAANNFRLKGLRELLLAFAKTVGIDQSLHPILVVAGSDDIRPYSTMAKRISIADRIIFTGALASVQNALAACDVAVLPSWYDPSSRFTLEALALAKPVITSRFNGAAEQFQSGRHGIVIDSPAHIPALAEAIGSLCHPQIRTAYTEAIVADNLKEKVSIARHVGQLRKVYDIILAQKKGILG